MILIYYEFILKTFPKLIC